IGEEGDLLLGVFQFDVDVSATGHFDVIGLQPISLARCVVMNPTLAFLLPVRTTVILDALWLKAVILYLRGLAIRILHLGHSSGGIFDEMSGSRRNDKLIAGVDQIGILDVVGSSDRIDLALHLCRRRLVTGIILVPLFERIFCNVRERVTVLDGVCGGTVLL